MVGILANIYPGAVKFLEDNGYKHNPWLGGNFVKGQDCITYEELRDNFSLAEDGGWKGGGVGDSELKRRVGLLEQRINRS